jgi:hypothetical protein
MAFAYVTLKSAKKIFAAGRSNDKHIFLLAIGSTNCLRCEPYYLLRKFGNTYRIAMSTQAIPVAKIEMLWIVIVANNSATKAAIIFITIIIYFNIGPYNVRSILWPIATKPTE